MVEFMLGSVFGLLLAMLIDSHVKRRVDLLNAVNDISDEDLEDEVPSGPTLLPGARTMWDRPDPFLPKEKK